MFFEVDFFNGNIEAVLNGHKYNGVRKPCPVNTVLMTVFTFNKRCLCIQSIVNKLQ